MEGSVREGEVLQGKYRVERILGRGGMGVVLAAHHLDLDEKVAIKCLLPDLLRHPEAVLRFEREARVAVKIKSEHVARVLDVARFDDGTPYLVMEYLDGSDLADCLARRGPFAIEQAVELVVQACEAIAEAHTLGIVHRDLKPANLFVIKGRDGLDKAKVLDFGISKNASWGASNARGLTSQGALLGSPEYMSPEQLTSPKAVDARSDIWSIGVTLFELLTGRVPFQGSDLLELASKIATAPTPRLAVPPALEAVILRCLAKDRDARFPDIAAIATALAPFAPRRTHALVERIARIVHASPRSSLPPATAFASTVLAPPAPTPRAERIETTVGMTLPVAPAPPPAVRRRPYLLAVGAASVLGALLAIGSCGVLMSAAARSAASRPSVADVDASAAPAPIPPPPLEVAAPSPAPSAAPPPKPSASSTTFRGTQGVTRASWRFGSTVYHGVLHTNGATGYADVEAVHPTEGLVTIRQDLRLQNGPKGWAYVGSHPRYADDGSSADYFPNAFYVERGTFTETCAIGTGQCTRVINESGR